MFSSPPRASPLTFQLLFSLSLYPRLNILLRPKKAAGAGAKWVKEPSGGKNEATRRRQRWTMEKERSAWKRGWKSWKSPFPPIHGFWDQGWLVEPRPGTRPHKGLVVGPWEGWKCRVPGDFQRRYPGGICLGFCFPPPSRGKKNLKKGKSKCLKLLGFAGSCPWGCS